VWCRRIQCLPTLEMLRTNAVGTRPSGASFNSDTFNAARIQLANSVTNYMNTQYIMQPPAFTTAGLPLNVAQTRGFWGRKGRNQNIALAEELE
jgi:hypothetical protein